MQQLLVGICVNYAENKLDYADKFQQLSKLNKTFQMYWTTVKRKALQSLTHNLSSLIECTSFLPTLTFEVKNSSQINWLAFVSVLGEKLLQKWLWCSCFITKCGTIFLFYGEKSSDCVADADVSKLCESTPPHPVQSWHPWASKFHIFFSRKSTLKTCYRLAS